MNKMNKLFWFFLIALLGAAPALAQSPATATDTATDTTTATATATATDTNTNTNTNTHGEVRVPLSQYEQWRDSRQQTPAPAAYAIGQSLLRVEIQESEKQSVASVRIDIQIETFEDDWTSVPLLPVGTALRETRINGGALQLVAIGEQLAWVSKKAQRASLQIFYTVPAMRTELGHSVTLPVPKAAANNLQLFFPGRQPAITIIPAVRQETFREGDATRVEASLAATDAVLIAWRPPSEQAYAMSRAHYSGKMENDAVVWRARYQVELFIAEPVSLALFPASVTLIELSIDGEPATVFAEAQQFATTITGRGLHQVEAIFQVPVQQGNGPPHVDLRVPQVPMSQFELTLPGDKEVKVNPPSNISSNRSAEQTEVSVFMPMVASLRFSWIDAIPQDLQIQTRANAISYHAFHAEEGVLHGHAMIAYEISRGDTNMLELELDSDVQVNRIQGDGVADWTVSEGTGEGEGARKRIKVFLDRAVKGNYVLDILYERLIDKQAGESVTLPLLSVLNVQRQRGMIALLAGRELTLNPVLNEGASAVGENQLPAFVRNQIEKVVAHTYKYTEPPKLAVNIAAPERKQGKFDAQVDTLISIGEVTLRGSATVEINVKAGSVMALTLELPENVNVLGVSGPSLRSRQVVESDSGQQIDLEFNREMDGQFRLEVNYERIMAESAADTRVPMIKVQSAEVEHGRTAVEALTAVEVQAVKTEQLSTLDINELPQQMVLKTTNPILLAYKYVGAEPPAQLVLKMIRHQEIEVQLANIENALYQTLITRDGLAVTTALFTIRNSRRQFLRLNLPPDSQIWSVFVDGKAEKPAQAGDKPSEVLIKLINSASGFPVEVVFATSIDKMDDWGVLSARLPRPDMVVTQTSWNVYLPVGPTYYVVDSNLDITTRGQWANPRTEAHQAANALGGRGMASEALRINVPSKGIRFSFEKLYANQSPEEAMFSIRYFDKTIADAGLYTSLFGAVLIWLGIIALARRRESVNRLGIAMLILLGALLLLASVGYLRTNPFLASAASLVIAAGMLIAWLWQRWRQWREQRDLMEEL